MSGKLITEVRKAVSDIFPNGCAAKAFSEVLTKIKEITDGQQEDLLSEFGDINALEKGEDPRELFERLESVMDSLAEHHNIVKTEAELVNQMLKVLEQDSDYDSAVTSMQRKKIAGGGLDVDYVKRVVTMTYNSKKKAAKRGKNRKKKKKSYS